MTDVDRSKWTFDRARLLDPETTTRSGRNVIKAFDSGLNEEGDEFPIVAWIEKDDAIGCFPVLYLSNGVAKWDARPGMDLVQPPRMQTIRVALYMHRGTVRAVASTEISEFEQWVQQREAND